MDQNENNKNSSQAPLVQKTLRAEATDLELWARVKDTMSETAGRPVSDTEVFGEVMARYFLPLKQNDEAARQISERAALIAEQEHRIATLESELQEARTNAETANSQQLDYERRLEELGAQSAAKDLKEGQHVVDLAPGYYEVLERVAEIEGKRRGQEWTVGHVIGFFTYSRFVLGNLNGDLNALPDAECRAIERRLGISFSPRRQAKRKEDAAL